MQIGDQLLSVHGVDVAHGSLRDVVHAFRQAPSPLFIVVARPATFQAPLPPASLGAMPSLPPQPGVHECVHESE